MSDNIHGYSSNDFYVSATSTDAWVLREFKNSKGDNFLSGVHIVTNDGVKSLAISYDGVTLHGRIDPNEVLTFENRVRRYVYIKSAVAANPTTYRIWAY